MKHYILFTEEVMPDPVYEGFVGGRVTISNNEEIEEIRFVAIRDKRFNALKKEYDMRSITDDELERLKDKVEFAYQNDLVLIGQDIAATRETLEEQLNYWDLRGILYITQNPVFIVDKSVDKKELLKIHKLTPAIEIGSDKGKSSPYLFGTYKGVNIFAHR